MIGAPAAIGLAAVLGWTMAFTIPALEDDIAALTARRDRLEKAIFDPVKGWSIRLKVAEANTKSLRAAVGIQNAKIADFERAAAERQRAADAALAAARADRERLEAGYTIILNQAPQTDIARQALNIVLGSIP